MFRFVGIQLLSEDVVDAVLTDHARQTEEDVLLYPVQALQQSPSLVSHLTTVLPPGV